ncbi:MAG: hypothetical protein RMI43_01230 [Candidatus Caldarchaeum sp.]|nr:hypothetical protein [Candidatus Caldarchaeum sp.]MDW8062777.1 hypothetical protein [Candidatus Caldarchaeum sp.]
MAKIYVDFYVRKIDEEMVSRLAMFGYSSACVEGMRGRMHSFSGVRLLEKVVVEASSRGDVLEAVRVSGAKALVSVVPATREALMTACRDERVATVMVHGGIAEFDRHVAEIFRNPIEVSVSELVNCFQNEKTWRNVTSFIRKAHLNGRQIIVSSGASSAEEVLPPHQLAHVAAALTDGKAGYYETVSVHPLQILRERSLA